MKRYRVYKRVTKHNITFFVKTEDARYVPYYGTHIGFISASSLDGAVEMVQKLTENGLAPVPQFTPMDYFKCNGKMPITNKVCGYLIPVPPGALKITCPQCGTIYQREKVISQEIKGEVGNVQKQSTSTSLQKPPLAGSERG